MMKKATSRLATLALCGALAVSGIGMLVVPAIAVGECSCEIVVHGSNCPLSQCTCDGVKTGQHSDECKLGRMNSIMTECVCDSSIHAKGCPRYLGEGSLLESSTADSDEVEGSDSDVTVESDVADGTSGSEDASDGSADADGFAGSEEAVDADGSADAGSENDGSADDADASDQEGDSEDSSAAEGGSEQTGSEQTDVTDGASEASSPEMEPLVTEVPEDLDAMEDGWEYPSGWSGYGEGQMEGNLIAAAYSFILEVDLAEHVEEIQAEIADDGEEVRIVDDGGGFGDVLAVYATLTGQTERYPYDVSVEDADDLLSSVYWSMTQVTGVSNSNGTAISVNRLTAEEAAELYGFDEEDVQTVIELAEQNETVDTLVEESIFAILTEEELAEVLELVPDDIDEDRRSVLLAGVSLVGKVDYFWGGKSLAYGWDDRWGEMRTVSSPGSSTYGTALPLGLDCSGFISWAFLNAFGSDDTVGEGTSSQWLNCEIVDWSDAEPGDLVFYYAPSSGRTNHVGIVLTVDDSGPETVVHCSSGGVQISSASGFNYVGRPAIYS